MHSPQHRFRSLQPTCTHRSTGIGHCSRHALTARSTGFGHCMQPTCTHRSTGFGHCSRHALTARSTGFGHCSRHALTAAQVSVTAADMHSPQHRFRSLQPTCTHRSTGFCHCSRHALTAAQVSVTAADVHSPQHIQFRSAQLLCSNCSDRRLARARAQYADMAALLGGNCKTNVSHITSYNCWLLVLLRRRCEW